MKAILEAQQAWGFLFLSFFEVNFFRFFYQEYLIGQKNGV